MPEFDSWIGKASTWHKMKIHDGYTIAYKGVALKDSDEGKSSQRAEFQAVHLAIHLRGKWPKVRIYLTVATGVASWQGPEKRLED